MVGFITDKTFLLQHIKTGFHVGFAIQSSFDFQVAADKIPKVNIEMKFIIALVALVAVAYADPIGITDNKIGDIITANIDVNLMMSSNVENNIMTLLAALLNQQAAVVGGDLPAPAVDGEQQPAAVPAMADITQLLTPENIEKVKGIIASLAKNQNQE